MNPAEQALLQQMHDIALPTQPGWWPLAIGWWVLAALVTLAICLSVLLFRRLRRQRKVEQESTRWRELALNEHRRIRATLSSTESAAHTNDPAFSELSVLMRRVALALLPRDQIASMTDEKWLQQLDDIGQTDAYTRGVGQLLGRVPYQKNTALEASDISHLLDLTEETILRARTPLSLNTHSSSGQLSLEKSTALQQESGVASI